MRCMWKKTAGHIRYIYIINLSIGHMSCKSLSKKLRTQFPLVIPKYIHKYIYIYTFMQCMYA